MTANINFEKLFFAIYEKVKKEDKEPLEFSKENFFETHKYYMRENKIAPCYILLNKKTYNMFANCFQQTDSNKENNVVPKENLYKDFEESIAMCFYKELAFGETIWLPDFYVLTPDNICSYWFKK